MTGRISFDFRRAVGIELGMANATTRFFRRYYWPAWLTLVVGLVATTWLARGLYRQGVELDEQRFKLEAHILAQLLEGTMERYEERLARLADYCAQSDDISVAEWNFRVGEMTQPNYNLPSVMHLAYCPKITAAEVRNHVARGRAVHGNQYASDLQLDSDHAVVLPVWHCWSRQGFQRIRPGTDLAQETESHPALGAALGRVSPWISSRPARVRRSDGRPENGFWFVLPVFKSDQVRPSPPRKARESNDDWRRRREAFYTSEATGALAVFISTDRMLDQAFNNPGVSTRMHVRLYTSPEPRLESLLNPVSTAPAKPQHREIIVLPWYVRRWALEIASTPRFDAESPRHRVWLVAGAGSGMTLLASALVGLALRARHRQELLTDQIREARDALAAAQQERQKLSHDLHDNTIQALYAIQLGLKHTSQKLEAEPAGARRELSAARTELDAIIAEIRRYITAEEAAREKTDLSGVLMSLVERSRAGTNARLEVRCDPDASERLTGDQAVQLANIAREALSNSLRHARPQQVRIGLCAEPEGVRLEISDDGIGFAPESQARGVGLTSMSTRASKVHGTLEIQSSPGQGTRVVARVPAPPLERPGPDWGDEEGDEW